MHYKQYSKTPWQPNKEDGTQLVGDKLLLVRIDYMQVQTFKSKTVVFKGHSRYCIPEFLCYMYLKLMGRSKYTIVL